MKTIIIGAGPAGMMAAIASSSIDNEVTILEKNDKAGRKLYITGKGRCNVTNACSQKEFIEHIVNNPKFMYSAIHAFSSEDTMSFFQDRGTPLVVERGKRVFPASYHSTDIIDTLVHACRDAGAYFHFNDTVESIRKEENHFVIKTTRKIYIADNLVIATGGLSYPTTGSTGDGYHFAESFNHSIIPPVPALVGIKVKEYIPESLYGFTLKNVSFRIQAGTFKHNELGELTFYRGSIEGPIVISTSSLINRFKDPVLMEIDLKPGLDDEQLDKRILRDIQESTQASISKLLSGLLPSELIPFFLSKASFLGQDKVSTFSKEKRKELVRLLKHFNLTYNGMLGYERAVVTSGGVNVNEINSSTMESKLVPNLYFAGEVIDVDAFTGGFNIQVALSTGYLAGKSILTKAEKN